MIAKTQDSSTSKSFAIIGAGGLGGPVALALAAAGARRLAVCDDDRVDLSNLQRQIQFATADIGERKVDALARELARRGYPREAVDAVAQRFSADNASELLAGADVVIDGSDNLATKFEVNDQAVAAGLPVVIAGVVRYTGQVLAVIPGQTGCYRCLFEAPPDDDDDSAASCAEAGVLGAAVAVIAGHAASAALALARGSSDCAGELLVYDDVASGQVRRVRFRPRPDCPACGELQVSN